MLIRFTSLSISLELLSYIQTLYFLTILTHIEDNENVTYSQEGTEEEDANASIRQSVEPDIIIKDPNLQLQLVSDGLEVLFFTSKDILVSENKKDTLHYR